MASSSTRSRSRSTRGPLHRTPSSSVDSNSDPPPCLNNSNDNDNLEKVKPSNLDTDLRLGHGETRLSELELFREKRHDWPPVKPRPKSTSTGRFFIKVYKEGVLIGRKLNLLAHNDYDDLVTSLTRMFNTNIHRPGESAAPSLPNKLNVLTYEDRDGDWMMVGDVPWDPSQDVQVHGEEDDDRKNRQVLRRHKIRELETFLHEIYQNQLILCVKEQMHGEISETQS